MTTTISTDDLSPENHLRSDLWPTMSLAQLARQQEIAITKISTLYSMATTNPSQSIQNIYAALQQALTDLNQLIDSRTKRT